MVAQVEVPEDELVLEYKVPSEWCVSETSLTATQFTQSNLNPLFPLYAHC